MRTQTPCKNCSFAIYKGDQQTGCEIGALRKYKDAGVEIIETEDKEKKFFIVDTICMFGRSKKWRKKQGNVTIDELYKRIREEIKLHATAIVFVSKDSTKQDVIRTTISLEKQVLKPSYIVFIQVKENSILPHEYRDFMFSLEYYNVDDDNGDEDIEGWLDNSSYVTSTIPWRLELVVEENPTTERCIDLAVRKLQKRSSHYAFFRAGFVVPKDYFATIDTLLNDNLKRFLVILPFDSDNNGLFIQKVIHQLLSGNMQKPLLTKIQQEKSICKDMILNITDLLCH